MQDRDTGAGPRISRISLDMVAAEVTRGNEADNFGCFHQENPTSHLGGYFLQTRASRNQVRVIRVIHAVHAEFPVDLQPEMNTLEA